MNDSNEEENNNKSRLIGMGVLLKYVTVRASLVAQRLKHLRPEFNPWVGKIPWRRKWQPIPVFLPRESHGWRSLVGYSPRGRKELDTTERSMDRYR